MPFYFVKRLPGVKKMYCGRGLTLWKQYVKRQGRGALFAMAKKVGPEESMLARREQKTQ